MNAFMNFVKKSLVKGTRDRVRVSKGVKASKKIGALSLPTSDLLLGPWGLASSFYFLVRLARRLLQGLCSAEDLGAIAMESWLSFFQTG